VLSFSFCLPFLQPPYPHAFEETIVDNIKKWVTEDPEASNECEWKYLGKNKPTDAEMLRTYAIGLLAMALCRYC
jgi:HIV-1 Vpr-binding protein